MFFNFSQWPQKTSPLLICLKNRNKDSVAKNWLGFKWEGHKEEEEEGGGRRGGGGGRIYKEHRKEHSEGRRRKIGGIYRHYIKFCQFFFISPSGPS